MKNYYGIDIEKKRRELLVSDIAKPIIAEIIKKADEAIKQDGYPALKFSEYMLFLKTGNIRTYHVQYFKRRNTLSYISIAYWLTCDEKYKAHLEDLIFNICDEFSWCLPEHSLIWGTPSAEQIMHETDLFQAETARLLTDVYAIVGDKLHYLVRDRIEYEIRRRVIDSFKYKEFHWLKPTCKTNWASVCAGGTLTALLAFGTEEEIQAILPSLYAAIEHFLEGIGEDGCCMEGYSYWNYGFGYFVIFARFILEYTSGAKNYFELEKVKNIATFCQKARLGKTRVAPFSDSVQDFLFSIGLFSYLKSLYPSEIKLPSPELGTLVGNVYSVKELLWLDTNYKEDDCNVGTFYFENAEWFIGRFKKYSFAAKAGHNNEPHNHNDIGSFSIVAADDSIPLVDLGAAPYNGFTFHPDHRYKMLQNASFGHSVPIINGKYQINGAEYKAKNACLAENTFSFDMEGAYEKGLIKRLNRRFELYEEKIVLRDTFEFSPLTKSVTERFISHTKPEITDDIVTLGSARLCFDSKKYSVLVSTDVFTSHSKSPDEDSKIDVYLIDFVPMHKNEEIFEVEIVIK